MTQNSCIHIGPSIHGQGVFASRAIEKDEVILVYTGRVITLEQALAKGGMSFNPLQIGPRLYIDTEPPGLLVNHSCEPNAGIRGDIFLVAIDHIDAGDEVTFDYSTTMSEKLEVMQCRCGKASCRDMIRDFHDLPPDLKYRYLQLGVVQSFIVLEHHGFANGSMEQTSNKGLLRTGDPRTARQSAEP